MTRLAEAEAAVPAALRAASSCAGSAASGISRSVLTQHRRPLHRRLCPRRHPRCHPGRLPLRLHRVLLLRPRRLRSRCLRPAPRSPAGHPPLRCPLGKRSPLRAWSTGGMGHLRVPSAMPRRGARTTGTRRSSTSSDGAPRHFRDKRYFLPSPRDTTSAASTTHTPSACRRLLARGQGR